ncbi:MAG: cupin domain-containing protein [Desulfovibrio sp.]|nr:MAG: cupin domain-containing protein [Desulfovibrio sp.]
MQDFPSFMKNPKNRIKQSSQHTDDIEGYVFDGVDGSQMALWTCYSNKESTEHIHEYDEYVVCVFGKYTVKMNNKAFELHPGGELYIPAGTSHSGSAVAGTRTIHAFGAQRAERELGC